MSKDNAPELQVSASIRDLANKLKKDFKIGEGGVIAVEKDFYASHLPETISINDVTRIQAHDADFMSAVALAAGELGIKHMSKQKDVNEVSIKWKAGRNDQGFNISRSKDSRDPKSGNTVTKYGVGNMKVVVHGSKNTAGSFKSIRGYLSELGASELGK